MFSLFSLNEKCFVFNVSIVENRACVKPLLLLFTAELSVRTKMVDYQLSSAILYHLQIPYGSH